MFAIGVPLVLQVYLLFSIVVLAFEESDHYVEAAAVTVVAVPVLAYVVILPAVGRVRLVEQWAAGHDINRPTALDATDAWTRGVVARSVAFIAVWAGLLWVVVGAIAGATGSRLVQYGILGAAFGISFMVIGVHIVPEAAARPCQGGDRR